MPQARGGGDASKGMPHSAHAIASRDRMTMPAITPREAMEMDEGFTGYYTREGSGEQLNLSIHLLFQGQNSLEGIGTDEHGEFHVCGQFSAVDVSFSIRYTRERPGRKFTGQRYPNVVIPSIAGRWSEEGGTGVCGKFHISHQGSERRNAPSYDAKRVKLYHVLEQLATGGFGVVSRVRRVTDGKILVWKEMNYQVNILREVEHPHIVKYYDTIIMRDKQRIYIIIEHCARGDVGAMIERYKRQRRQVDEGFIWKTMNQILLALHTCHHREEVILHRDLKPANILLDHDYNVKVADFGLATVVTSDVLACSKVGTPLYMSPEQIQGAGYTEKSDIWSLACIAYEMAALMPPFDAKNQAELARCIHDGKFASLPPGYSEELMRTIAWSLRIKPDERPSVGQLLSIVGKREGGQSTAPSSHMTGRSSAATPASPSGGNGMTPPSVAASPSGRNGMPPPPVAASPSSFGVPPPLHPRSPENQKLQNRISGDGNSNSSNISDSSNNIGGLVFELNPASGRYAVTAVVQDSPADKSGQASVGDELLCIDAYEVAGRSWSTIQSLAPRPPASAGGLSEEGGLFPLSLQFLRADTKVTATLFLDGSLPNATVHTSPQPQQQQQTQRPVLRGFVPQLQAEGAIGGSADDDSRPSSPQKQPAAQLQKSVDTSKELALEGRIAQLEGELGNVKMALEAKDLMMREKDVLLAKAEDRNRELSETLDAQNATISQLRDELLRIRQPTSSNSAGYSMHAPASPLHGIRPPSPSTRSFQTPGSPNPTNRPQSPAPSGVFAPSSSSNTPQQSYRPPSPRVGIPPASPHGGAPTPSARLREGDSRRPPFLDHVNDTDVLGGGGGFINGIHERNARPATPNNGGSTPMSSSNGRAPSPGRPMVGSSSTPHSMANGFTVGGSSQNPSTPGSLAQKDAGYTHQPPSPRPSTPRAGQWSNNSGMGSPRVATPGGTPAVWH